MTNEVAVRILHRESCAYCSWGSSCPNDCDNDECDVKEAVSLAISALERDRWISVEDDGVPDKDGHYLFYGDQYFVPDHNGDPDNYKDIKSGYWMANQSLPNYIGNMIFTHWRPLPEPPKEKT